MKLYVSKIRNELDLVSGTYLNVLVLSDGEKEADVPLADAVFEHVMVTFREGMEDLENPANDLELEPGELESAHTELPMRELSSLGPEVDLATLGGDEGRDDDDEWVVSQDQEEGDA